LVEVPRRFKDQHKDYILIILPNIEAFTTDEIIATSDQVAGSSHHFFGITISEDMSESGVIK
jgi:hypothetical protein